MASPYDVLGVDPDADEAAIESAYRRRVLETHPDHGGTSEQFRAVREAYEAISTGAIDERKVEIDERETDESHERSRETDPTGGKRAKENDQTADPSARVEYLDYEAIVDHGWDLGDDDLFENAASAGLDPDDYGRFLVEPNETVLEAAENRGFAWPYACRGGACANCAVAVVDGEMSIPVNTVLSEQMIEEGIRLSCLGIPESEELRIVYNVKHLPALDELRLPPHPFDRANADR